MKSSSTFSVRKQYGNGNYNYHDHFSEVNGMRIILRAENKLTLTKINLFLLHLQRSRNERDLNTR
jgi:hypothetical protein